MLEFKRTIISGPSPFFRHDKFILLKLIVASFFNTYVHKGGYYVEEFGCVMIQ